MLKIGLELEMVPRCTQTDDPCMLPCSNCSDEQPYYCAEICSSRESSFCHIGDCCYCDQFVLNDCYSFICKRCSNSSNCPPGASCDSCKRRAVPFCIYFKTKCSPERICDWCEAGSADCEECISSCFRPILYDLQRKFDCLHRDCTNYSLDQDVIYVVPDESMPGVEVVTQPLPPDELIQLHARLIEELKADYLISPEFGCGGHLTVSLASQEEFTEESIERILSLVQQFLPVLTRNSCEGFTHFRDEWFRQFPTSEIIRERKYLAMRVKWQNRLIEFRYPDATQDLELFKKTVLLLDALVRFGLSEEPLPEPAISLEMSRRLYHSLIRTGGLSRSEEIDYLILRRQFEEIFNPGFELD